MPTKKELAKLHAAANRVRKLQAERYKQAPDGEAVSVGSPPPPDLTKVPRTREAFAQALDYSRQSAYEEGRWKGKAEAQREAEERNSGRAAEISAARSAMQGLTELAKANAALSEGLSRVVMHLTKRTS